VYFHVVIPRSVAPRRLTRFSYAPRGLKIFDRRPEIGTETFDEYVTVLNDDPFDRLQAFECQFEDKSVSLEHGTLESFPIFELILSSAAKFHSCNRSYAMDVLHPLPELAK